MLKVYKNIQQFEVELENSEGSVETHILYLETDQVDDLTEDELIKELWGCTDPDHIYESCTVFLVKGHRRFMLG